MTLTSLTLESAGHAKKEGTLSLLGYKQYVICAYDLIAARSQRC